MDLRPVAARLVVADRAEDVVGPAYDSLTPAQRRHLLEVEPASFFGVIRSRLEYPDADPAKLLADNAARLARLVAGGYYSPVATPSLYLYELSSSKHRQVAVVGNVAVQGAATGHVRAHELTRPAKEADLGAYLTTLGIQSSPVGLTYRSAPAINAVVARATAAPPALDFRTSDGVRQRVWRANAATGAALLAGFAAVDNTYIVDGHHRVGAALAAGRSLFFAALVPDDQLRLLAYHRLIHNPPADLSARLERLGAERIQRLTSPLPGSIVVVTPAGALWSLRLSGSDGEPDVGATDRLILSKLFDIADVQTDPRLGYLPGGDDAFSLLQRLPSEFAAVVLHPISVPDLLDYVDRGQTLPPKSTWFEPKLRSGLFIVPG